MNLTLIDDWKITIGKYVLFGPNVTLCTTGHPIHPDHRMDGMYSFPITIGDKVWIGANTIVLPGVTIGENSVIPDGVHIGKNVMISGKTAPEDYPEGRLASGRTLVKEDSAS
jgi:galactoside O-acetyltransferase